MSQKKVKTEKFADNFIKSTVDSLQYVPELYVKYRGNDVQFKGRRISCEDFTKFVKRGENFIPLVCTERQNGDVVLDFAPILSVGIAEMVVTENYADEFCSDGFLEWCHNLSFGKDWYEVTDKARDIMQSSDQGVVLATAMRSSLIDFRFPEIRQVYATMMAMRFVNPQSYCKALMEAVRLCYPMFVVMAVESARTSLAYGSQNLYSKILFGKMFNRMKKVRVNISEKKYFLSDCRGLGILAFLLFTLDVYNTYAPPVNKTANAVFTDYKVRSDLLKRFSGCIGEDAVGRYLKTGVLAEESGDTIDKVLAYQSDASLLDCEERGVLDRWGYGVGLCEAHALWKHATGSSVLIKPGFATPIDVYYASRRGIIHTFIDFTLSKRGMKLEAKLKDANHEALMKELMERVGIDNLRERVTKQAKAEAQGQVAALQRKVSSLESQLQGVTKLKEDSDELVSRKQKIIDDLLSEVRDLRTKVQSTYDYDDSVDGSGVDSSVSREDMLALVNQFRLVVIGGVNNIDMRMAQAGFTNYHVIESAHAGAVDSSGDFFCIYTRFVSHQLIYTIESQNKEQLDRFFYFNGTNVDALLRSCYEFMQKWLVGVPEPCSDESLG